MATRRRRSREEARRLILDAAERLLTEGGPEAVRLKQVGRAVGVSHPAVLHHFGSREGLLLELESRAMERLREELLGDQEISSEQVFERVSQTLGDRGYARLLAWAVLGNLAGGEDADTPLMMKELADHYHGLRRDSARREGRAAPTYEDTVFAVRLSAAALFGDALIGPLLTRSAGLRDDARMSRRFRAWLAELLEEPDARHGASG